MTLTEHDEFNSADDLIWRFNQLAYHMGWLKVAKGCSREDLSVKWSTMLCKYSRDHSGKSQLECMRAIKYFGSGMRWWGRVGDFTNNNVRDFVARFLEFESKYGVVEEECLIWGSIE